MVAQYRNEWNLSAFVWIMISTASGTMNTPQPARYPQFRVMLIVSPPVSPSVVAAILMIQKNTVTSGTLLDAQLLDAQ